MNGSQLNEQEKRRLVSLSKRIHSMVGMIRTYETDLAKSIRNDMSQYDQLYVCSNHDGLYKQLNRHLSKFTDVSTGDVISNEGNVFEECSISELEHSELDDILLPWFEHNPIQCAFYVRNDIDALLRDCLPKDDPLSGDDPDLWKDLFIFLSRHRYMYSLNGVDFSGEELDTRYLKTDSQETNIKKSNKTTKTNKAMDFSKMFKGLQVGKINSGVAMSMTGEVAIQGNNGAVSYDVSTNTLVDHMDMTFGQDSGMFYALPTKREDLKPGDILIEGKQMLFIKKITKGALVCVSPNELEVTKVNVKNLFGFNMVSKVVSVMNMSGEKTEGDNPFGNMNPMMMMMLSGDDDSSMSDMLPMMMMQNGGGAQMNPMMMMMMMKGDKGDSSMKDMMMMSMMMGGDNPFFPQDTKSKKS